MKRRGFLDAIAGLAAAAPFVSKSNESKSNESKSNEKELDDPEGELETVVDTTSLTISGKDYIYKSADGTETKIDMSSLFESSSFAQLDDTPKSFF